MATKTSHTRDFFVTAFVFPILAQANRAGGSARDRQTGLEVVLSLEGIVPNSASCSLRQPLPLRHTTPCCEPVLHLAAARPDRTSQEPTAAACQESCTESEFHRHRWSCDVERL